MNLQIWSILSAILYLSKYSLIIHLQWTYYRTSITPSNSFLSFKINPVAIIYLHIDIGTTSILKKRNHALSLGIFYLWCSWAQKRNIASFYETKLDCNAAVLNNTQLLNHLHVDWNISKYMDNFYSVGFWTNYIGHSD